MNTSTTTTWPEGRRAGSGVLPDGLSPHLLRPREAAQFLAISPKKLWSLTKDTTTKIPVVRIGKSVRYPARLLAQWAEGLAAKGGTR